MKKTMRSMFVLAMGTALFLSACANKPARDLESLKGISESVFDKEYEEETEAEEIETTEEVTTTAAPTTTAPTTTVAETTKKAMQLPTIVQLHGGVTKDPVSIGHSGEHVSPDPAPERIEVRNPGVFYEDDYFSIELVQDFYFDPEYGKETGSGYVSPRIMFNYRITVISDEPQYGEYERSEFITKVPSGGTQEKLIDLPLGYVECEDGTRYIPYSSMVAIGEFDRYYINMALFVDDTILDEYLEAVR